MGSSSAFWRYRKGDTLRNEKSEPTFTEKVIAKNGDTVGLRHLSPEVRAGLDRLMRGQSFDGLYSKALGMPNRVRRYVRKLWKLQDVGRQWDYVAGEMAAEANKILVHHMDVLTLTQVAIAYEKEVPDRERLQRLSDAATETDALLIIFSPYFLPGITARVAKMCLVLKEMPDSEDLPLDGLFLIANHGTVNHNYIKRIRRSMLDEAKRRGWEIPERDG